MITADNKPTLVNAFLAYLSNNSTFFSSRILNEKTFIAFEIIRTLTTKTCNCNFSFTLVAAICRSLGIHAFVNVEVEIVFYVTIVTFVFLEILFHLNFKFAFSACEVFVKVFIVFNLICFGRF